MDRRWRGFGLKTRVVLALAVVILAIQAAYVVLEDSRFEQRQSSALQDSADNLALLYAGAVANAVWEYDREAAKGQLQAMRVIDGFARAVIRESSGQEFVAVDAAIDDQDPAFACRRSTVEGRPTSYRRPPGRQHQRYLVEGTAGDRAARLICAPCS